MNVQILNGDGVALYPNPQVSPAEQAYGSTRAAILHKPGFDAAEKEISGWPGYASTKLHALPSLAKNWVLMRSITKTKVHALD